MRQVVVNVDRVDDADAGKSQPLLLGHIGQLLDPAQAQRMRRRLQQPSSHQCGHLLGHDRTIGNALAVTVDDLDQRLEPDHAA